MAFHRRPQIDREAQPSSATGSPLCPVCNGVLLDEWELHDGIRTGRLLYRCPNGCQQVAGQLPTSRQPVAKLITAFCFACGQPFMTTPPRRPSERIRKYCHTSDCTERRRQQRADEGKNRRGGFQMRRLNPETEDTTDHRESA